MSRLTSLFNVQYLLWLALALALAGSLKHLSYTFAGVDGNLFFGVLQAIAIDAGVFALAYTLRQRKADKRPVRPLWFGVGLFTVISIYGNLSYALQEMEHIDNLPIWILVTRPYILAASLPVLVLFLSELLSDDRQHMAQVEAKQAKKTTKQASNKLVDAPSTSAIDKARAAKQDKLTSRRQEVGNLLAEGLSPDDIANRFDVSRRTILRDIEALQLTDPADIPGTIGRNGRH
jgi:DNA-binding CsgD family transcriptional regulator